MQNEPMEALAPRPANIPYKTAQKHLNRKIALATNSKTCLRVMLLTWKSYQNKFKTIQNNFSTTSAWPDTAAPPMTMTMAGSWPGHGLETMARDMSKRVPSKRISSKRVPSKRV